MGGYRSEHHAADVYHKWKRLIKQAENSIVVFTPYFDSLLPRLLRSSRIARIEVVTDLSPQSGALDYLAQLRSIKRLLNAQIVVRSLPRLHAKVLWVDDEQVIYGSQNFTNYARSSKEVNGTPLDRLRATALAKTLTDWLEESSPIDLMLVENLLKDARKLAKASEAARKDFSAEVDRIVAAHEARIAEDRRQLERAHPRVFSSTRLREIASRNPSRLARGTAIVRMRTAGRWDSGYYESLMADSLTDLTRWQFALSGKRETVELKSLFLYPVIDEESGRMTWARVGRSRITYVHQGVVHGNLLSTRLGQVKVAQNFPVDGSDQVNVVWTFTPVWSGQEQSHQAVTVRTLFDGESLSIVGAALRASAGVSEEFVSQCETTFSDLVIDSFLDEYFTRFRYKPGSLGRERHNVRDFFDGDAYTLRLMQFRKVPVLVARSW